MVDIIPSNGQQAPGPYGIRAVARDDAHADECAELQKQIAERLVILRSEFQECVANYSIRIQGLISQIGDILAEEPTKLTGPDRKARIKALHQTLNKLDKLDLKPSKGRRRDLKAIEKFSDEISSEIATW